MNKRRVLESILLSAFLLIPLQFLHSQSEKPEDTEVWKPYLRIVKPGVAGSAPSDAIPLFDGSGSLEWVDKDGNSAQWEVSNGIMTVTRRTGSIYTRRDFGDCQLHIEWRTPDSIEGKGQGRGNSGIYFQSRYEVQILDSYNNPTYINGQAASIYKQYPPLVNASKPPGEWQVYDIIFLAPLFDEAGEREKTGSFTVFHNGVLVQNSVEILGTTEFIGKPKNLAHDKAPIMLQNHGNPVSFRNIWIREL